MNVNVLSRVSRLITASAVAVAAAFTPIGSVVSSTTASAASLMSAAAITEDMGVGWNLGNSLDSTGSGTYSDITQYERQWGNPVVTQSLIDTVKAKGFNTIRVPVSWYQHLSSDGKYTIDSNWLARVKEVVDYAYNQDMYVILNIHHEEWINRSDFSSAGSAMETQLRAVWLQIADYFSDYGQRLIFEGMNEPRAAGTSIEWSGDSSCYAVVNQLNEAFVETVRSVDSPYQSTRMLMIPGYAASCSASVFDSLTVPKASGSIDADNDGDDDYIAVSIHAYSPYYFAMGDGDHSAFSASYKSELLSIFSKIDSKFLEEGVPVVIGEFGASNFGYDSARVEWAEFYMENATQYGMPCVLWDNNVESNNGGEAHGYVRRSNNTWYTSGEKVVNALISTRNSTEWDIVSHPMYIHDDISNGVSVSYASDGNITLPNISGFVSGTELAFVYSNDEIPQTALMDSGWGGWTEISPYDYAPDIKTAYVSYDQVYESWSSSSAVNYMKITNMSSIGLKGVYLLTIPSQDSVQIDENSFPDSIFRSYVSDSFDADGNGLLSESEIKSVTVADVSDKGIASLKGIEIFTELTKLDASGNKLTGVDLSGNTKLSSCDLSDNSYDLGAVSGSYSLSELPDCFDVSKASGWTGAEFDSSANSLIDFTSETVTYSYDCGNNITAQFSLSLSITDGAAGDFDGDNTINNKDLTILRRYLSDDSTDISSGGDMNGDGVINNKDLALLRRKLAGYDV